MDAPAQPDGLDRRGLVLALLSYGTWGVFPLFWRLLGHVPTDQQLAHRIFWAAVLLLLLVVAFRRGPELRAALSERRTRRTIALGASLLAVNWGVFLLAVASDQVLQASLGYYINPLVSVVLGMAFLRERLRPPQWVAVGLATAGVLVMTTQVGVFPWMSLMLAGAFGFYGLVRKTAPMEALPGSSAEALMLAPLCLGYLGWVHAGGQGDFGHGGAWTTLLLVCTGPVTALPVLWFAGAARRLPLSTVGLLQYIAPTGHLLCAVFAFGEPFTRAHVVAFGLIWAGLVVFATDAFRRHRGPRAPRRARGSARP